jgi:hypothetical protein
MGFAVTHQETPDVVPAHLGPFATDSEAEAVCDELWSIECRQEIVDDNTDEYRARWGTGEWSPKRVRLVE